MRLRNKALIMACLIIGVSSIAVSQSTSFVRLPYGTVSINQFNLTLIPNLKRLEIDTEQSIMLHVSGTPDIKIVPIDYSVAVAQSPEERCGMYFMSEKGVQSFIEIIGEEYDWDCGNLQAIGTMSDNSSRPRLITVYRTVAPSGAVSDNSYILSWNSQKNSYELNIAQTNWLMRHRQPSNSVARAKRLLERFPPNWKGESYGKSIQ